MLGLDFLRNFDSIPKFGLLTECPRPKQFIHEGSNAPIAGHPGGYSRRYRPRDRCGWFTPLKFVETIHA
jgi:hypothetical protein